MQIIPVIDLLNGVVVHAKKGAREHYQPIQSQLTTSHQPLDIVEALLTLHPFTQLYIADLNAIQKTRNSSETNYQVIENIAQRYPFLELWVDAGISNNKELDHWKKLNIRLIIGSENFSNIGDYCALGLKSNFVLSLDFMPHGYQGPSELLADTQYWPKNVIVMSLANVGADAGANTNLLTEVMLKAKNHHFYAAGGVRDIEDLNALKGIGIQAALIATALHQRQISKSELKQFFKN